MKIGDEVYIHGYVDEIRQDTVIIRNDGGYFGTVPSEVVEQVPNEDLISRQRLRETLKRELVIVNNNEMYWQGWHDCTVAVETRITDAPSVVPNEKYDYSKSVWENIKAGNGISKEIPKEPKEDYISRQDAIDALMRSSVYAWSTEEDQIAHEWALNIISKLPAKE